MLLSDVEIVFERPYNDLIMLVLLLLINNDQEGRLIILRVLLLSLS
jgi:hypothetical protein